METKIVAKNAANPCRIACLCNFQDNFADMQIAFKSGMRCGGLGQRKLTINHRAQGAAFHHRPDVFGKVAGIARLGQIALRAQGGAGEGEAAHHHLGKIQLGFGTFEEGDLHPEHLAAIATKLGVTEEEVTNMNRRLGGDASLNAPLRADGESEWQDWLADDDAVSQETALADSEEKSIRMSLLEEAMQELTDREKHILTERRLKDDPVTLEELAGQYGVSRERVRQIEVRAFEKLQKAMRAAAEERNLVDA